MALVTEEPDELIAHVRVCGGTGWVTAGSTRRHSPLEVLETDFSSDAKGKAIPYGIYDIQLNAGYKGHRRVSHETAKFAVAAIRRWWLEWGVSTTRVIRGC